MLSNVDQLTPSCCPAYVNLLDEAAATDLAAALRAMANPVRLRLLHHIASNPGTTACACHLPDALGITQPTLSHHLKQLVDCGVVIRVQQGRWAHYHVSTEVMARLTEAMAGTLCQWGLDTELSSQMARLSEAWEGAETTR